MFIQSGVEKGSDKYAPGFKDRFMYAASQWETTLHSNVVSHWLGAYTKWPLWFDELSCFISMHEKWQPTRETVL